MSNQPRSSNDGIDFSRIDLGQIDLDLDQPPKRQAKPSRIPRWLTLSFMLAGLTLVVWLPTTHFYKSSTYSNALFFTVCVLGLSITFIGGRFLWAWMEEAAENWSENPSRLRDRPPRVIPAWERWLTLAAAVAMGTLTAFALPDALSYRDGSWLLKATGGALTAVIGGRWLFIQAGRAVPKAGRKRFKLPTWFKWFNLGLLVIGAVLVLTGDLIFGSNQAQGYLSALGLALGIGGAIWLARRFDEMEEKFKAQGRQVRNQKEPD